MSQENVEIVRREYVALAARDWTAIAEVWHPDIELEADRTAPGAGTYRGLEEITRFFDTWAEPYSQYRIEAAEIIDAGDRIVAIERFAGKGLRGTASDYWIEGWLFRVITFKDGKIWRVKEHPTRAEALEAAGLSE
jgi:ketosteroid isomerase-like protein